MSSEPTTAPAKRRYSLFEIEAGWIPLLEARIEAETDPELSNERPVCPTCGGNPAGPCITCEGAGRLQSARELAIEAADVALAEHSMKEVEKADSYIGLIGFLEAAVATRRAEAKRQAEVARITEGMLAQVKATAVSAMSVLNRKRIEGSRGYLLAKGNGGLAPLLVQDPGKIPDEFIKLEGWVNAKDWVTMIEATRRRLFKPDWEPAAHWTARTPDNTGIRRKLDEPCPTCSGGDVTIAGVTCETCGGSGKQAVPGASIGERGTHLEVK